MSTWEQAGSRIRAMAGAVRPERPHDRAFEAVFLERYPRIVQVLLRIVGERSHAEELADDVFWKLYCRPELLDQEDVGGWLYRTATNLGIDALRSTARRRDYERKAFQEHPSPPNPLDSALQAERARRVRQALAKLKPQQAQLLVLRHSGLSYKELAEVLDVKPSSIGALLARAEAEFEKEYQR